MWLWEPRIRLLGTTAPSSSGLCYPLTPDELPGSAFPAVSPQAGGNTITKDSQGQRWKRKGHKRAVGLGGNTTHVDKLGVLRVQRIC